MKIFQTWTQDKRAQEKISLRSFFISFSGAESAHVSHERAKRKINGAGQKKTTKSEQSESKERVSAVSKSKNKCIKKVFVCYLHSSADGAGIRMKYPSHFQTSIVWWTQFSECCNTQLVPEGLVHRTRTGPKKRTVTDLFPSLPVMALFQKALRTLHLITRRSAHLLLKQLATNTHVCFDSVYPRCLVLQLTSCTRG